MATIADASGLSRQQASSCTIFVLEEPERGMQELAIDRKRDGIAIGAFGRADPHGVRGFRGAAVAVRV